MHAEWSTVVHLFFGIYVDIYHELRTASVSINFQVVSQNESLTYWAVFNSTYWNVIFGGSGWIFIHLSKLFLTGKNGQELKDSARGLAADIAALINAQSSRSEVIEVCFKQKTFLQILLVVRQKVIFMTHIIFIPVASYQLMSLQQEN